MDVETSTGSWAEDVVSVIPGDKQAGFGTSALPDLWPDGYLSLSVLTGSFGESETKFEFWICVAECTDWPLSTFSGKGYIHIYKYTKHSINNENTTRVRATPFVTVQEGVGSLEDMAVKDILLHLSPLTDMNYCALAAVGQPESELPAPAFKNISFVICILFWEETI